MALQVHSISSSSSFNKQAFKPFVSSLVDTVRVKIKAPKNLIERLRTLRLSRKYNKFFINGAFGATATIEHTRGSEYFFLEASPKLLTGQNLIGIEDVHRLACELIFAVLDRATLHPNEAFRRQIESGAYTLQRVDLVAHCDCGSPSRAVAVMIALRRLLAGGMKVVSFYKYETIYVAQHSRHRSFKIYDKGAEMRAHPLAEGVARREYLMESATSLIRFEIVLRSPSLQAQGLSAPLAWNHKTVRKILQEELDAIFSRVEGIVPDPRNASKLSPALLTKFNAWVLGDKLAFLRSPTTYPANRDLILKTVGVDIGSCLDLEQQQKSVATVGEILKAGFGFKAHPLAWETLKTAAQATTSSSFH